MGGGNFWILWGDIELMGGPSSPPSTRENPDMGNQGQQLEQNELMLLLRRMKRLVRNLTYRNVQVKRIHVVHVQCRGISTI